MGQDDITERKEAFKNYKIDGELMKMAKIDAIVLHCLPAHRNEEISPEVFKQFENIIFDESENRLHTQKSVMVKLMG